MLHAFRLSVGQHWLKPAAVATIAFVACQMVAAVALDIAGIRRELSLDRVLLPERPRILIVGSSHTARALDGEALQSALQVPVAQLTYPGAFAFEQDLAMERYVARAKPPLVLLEVGSEFYVHTQRAPYASREIEEADPVRTWWGVRLLVDRSDQTLAERLVPAWDRIRSMLAKLTHTGIVRHARHERPWPSKGFEPDDRREDGVTDEQLAAALAADRGADIDISTATAFRRWQKDRLLAMGVKDVRFFTPPIADPTRRGRSDSICASLGRDCMPMDVEFVRSLPPRLWVDRSHLRPEGARLYTHWLAERLRAVQ